MRRPPALLQLVLVACICASGCDSDDQRQSVSLTGNVLSGDGPIEDSAVTLLATAADGSGAPIALGSGTTDANGEFSLFYVVPSDPDSVLYLVARSGRRGAVVLPGAFVLASVLGASTPPTVVINERTTVASGYALAQFLDGTDIGGPSPGLQNAAAMVQNFANVGTGGIAAVLADLPNGSATSTLATFNSPSNSLSACTRDAEDCAALLEAATPPGGSAPQTTFEAFADLAAHPWIDPSPLFDVAASVADPPYEPVLGAAPAAWTLALKFWGDGQVFGGPGAIAIDRFGRAWANNNYMHDSRPLQPVCASGLLFRLDTTRPGGNLDVFQGGGLDGAGFGITIDPRGDVWVGNFGFKGRGCTITPSSDSVSKFSSLGRALSPSDGFTQGNISWPQGTVSDRSGNIWVASCANRSVTVYFDGDPDDFAFYANEQIEKPFGLAIDAEGVAWVTGNRSSNVLAYRADGTQLPGSPFGADSIDAPMGIAVDSAGHKWVSNSHVLDVPCDTSDPTYDIPDDPSLLDGSIALLEEDGSVAPNSPFRGGGVTIPWGIAVDGYDNVWVANFGQQRLSHFCGTSRSNCPPDAQVGDAISPEGTGYTFDGLQRNTGVTIDASGNVWLANNWKNVIDLFNPGGDGLVVYVGVAGPVMVPIIGPPQPAR